MEQRWRRDAQDSPTSSRSWIAVLGALGVVFGDIGTSPLYALHTAFSMEHNAVSVSQENVYGIISMVAWTITLIVTGKYVLLVTRADNDGQGGILALLALLRRHVRGRRGLAVVTVLGMLGASLFFGDAIITPAISVVSAVEGLVVVSPQLGHLVVPVSAAVLVVLFAVQPFGTGRVGRAFGPVMLGWFATLAVLGIPQIVAHPQILAGLSPHWAIELVIRQPFQSFVLLGAVVLTVTGAEALYADLGHFGARAVRLGWLTVVMPALLLVYLGQGALVISQPGAVSNPLFHLAPPVLQLPLVIYATVATIIASQAVISGAFSVTRQAMRLGLLPRLAVKHTSRQEEGQVYLPAVNWVLFISVLALVLIFSSSAELASAYGLAVTGTLILESCIFLVFAHAVWGWGRWNMVAYVAAIGVLEILLFAANTAKLFAGGWLPVAVAAVMMLIMTTWQRGYQQVSEARRAMEGPLTPFIASLQGSGIRREPGVAVFPHPGRYTTPLAMKQCVKRFHLLHEHVIIVRLVNADVPHIRRSDRISVDNAGFASDGVVHVTVRVGFNDRQDIPQNLDLAIGRTRELDIDLDGAVYFLSVLTLRPPRAHRLRDWREKLFLALEKNQANRTEVFHLPPTRTIVLGSELHV
ncbi:potassium transporter Kup [Brevibacterium daeguense]|uniref:Probable potassium transport system protein Kup n=1 Tax=Brevibacterium daeguense TaxID=909936 RepID=A0ABP8EH41_9MICO|nr:KUP/HAK/KT family potassium transporter [Brevibacterium daeguense]